MLCLRGESLPRDYVAAQKWFTLAAAAGDQTVREPRDRLERLLPPEQVFAARKQAREWRPFLKNQL